MAPATINKDKPIGLLSSFRRVTVNPCGTLVSSVSLADISGSDSEDRSSSARNDASRSSSLLALCSHLLLLVAFLVVLGVCAGLDRHSVALGNTEMVQHPPSVVASDVAQV